jgi:hypothetical protein
MPKGSCLCGAISFEVTGELAPGDACHCTQCRRQSGHYWASTNVPRDRLTVRGMDNIAWFQSSEKIRRGFCRTCGSVLFWDPQHKDWTSIAMGAFDSTNTHLEMHIFVGEKGDYYEIADGVPQKGP